MTALKTEGKCFYCDKMFTKAGISRHLSSHLKKMEKESPSTKKAIHLKVSAYDMFLHLLVSETCLLGDLDHFLRAIWLECCGHMSSFSVKGKRYNNDWDSSEFGEKMSTKIINYKKGTKLDYEYDFGSTTALDVQVVNEYMLKVPKKILLLSRNEPLPILCHSCNEKPAVTMFSVCIYEGPNMFCKACTKKHEKSCLDFEDYSRVQVVNSPRMGVCGYEGGTIDKKRDGAWKG